MFGDKIFECFSLDKLLSYLIYSTNQMEAGGKYRVLKGRNSGKSSKIASSFKYTIIGHKRNLASGFNWICNDTAGILKSVLVGFVLLLFFIPVFSGQ